MPKVVITHPVQNVDHWLSKNSERIELFAAWGTNVTNYASADGSNMVALTIDVHDMDLMQESLATAEIDQAKKSHGVLDPIVMYVAPE